MLSVTNIQDLTKRLEIAIRLITEEIKENNSLLSYIDVVKLNRITILESTKLYFTKEIDKVNKKERAFINYKQFVVSVSAIILDINTNYKYLTIIEGAHHQRFFA